MWLKALGRIARGFLLSLSSDSETFSYRALPQKRSRWPPSPSKGVEESRSDTLDMRGFRGLRPCVGKGQGSSGHLGPGPRIAKGWGLLYAISKQTSRSRFCFRKRKGPPASSQEPLTSARRWFPMPKRELGHAEETAAPSA